MYLHYIYFNILYFYISVAILALDYEDTSYRLKFVISTLKYLCWFYANVHHNITLIIT